MKAVYTAPFDNLSTHQVTNLHGQVVDGVDVNIPAITLLDSDKSMLRSEVFPVSSFSSKLSVAGKEGLWDWSAAWSATTLQASNFTLHNQAITHLLL